MSSHRESFKNRGIPGDFANTFDFPIPHCEKCEAQMVRLEGKWGCKSCSKITVLRPTGAVRPHQGRLISELAPTTLPLGEAYPNRAARRRVRA